MNSLWDFQGLPRSRSLIWIRQAALLPLEAPGFQALRGARPANSKVSGGNQVVAVSRSLDDTKTIEQQAWISYRISEDDDDHRTENMYIDVI